ncbi:unnamed protein product, partial [Meganyctiphanes norvegica]
LFRIILLVLYPLHMLPYTWLVINLAIVIKQYKSNPMKMIDTWDRASKRSKLIFTVFEDAPQLLLHSVFIINSAITQEHALVHQGIEMLNWLSFMSLASSAASIALTLTLYQDLSNLDIFIQWTTSFLSIGTRALLCASYASSVVTQFSVQTWTIILPAVA